MRTAVTGTEKEAGWLLAQAWNEPHTCRQGHAGLWVPPGAQVAPSAPLGVGTEAGLAFREEGRSLPKSP